MDISHSGIFTVMNPLFSIITILQHCVSETISLFWKNRDARLKLSGVQIVYIYIEYQRIGKHTDIFFLTNSGLQLISIYFNINKFNWYCAPHKLNLVIFISLIFVEKFRAFSYFYSLFIRYVYKDKDIHGEMFNCLFLNWSWNRGRIELQRYKLAFVCRLALSQ